MSRSKHQTLKSVFGGLFREGATDDVAELVAKMRIERETLKRRKAEKAEA